jgi:hypothetical protein
MSHRAPPRKVGHMTLVCESEHQASLDCLTHMEGDASALWR